MYIPIGGDMAVRDKTVIGIFDLDNSSYSRHTRKFLEKAEKNGEIISVSDELPKAFVLTQEFGMNRIYLTQFGSATLEKRFDSEEEKTGVSTWTNF